MNGSSGCTFLEAHFACFKGFVKVVETFLRLRE